MLRLLPFGWFVYRHKRRAKRILKNVLKDHPLPRHRKRRIQSLALYAIADAYLHRQYRGFPLTHEEEVSVVLLGAATALCDDLTDEFGYTFDQLKQLINDLKPIQPENEVEAACLHIFTNALPLHPKPKVLIQYLLTAIKAQAESKKQETQNLSVGEIWKITVEKGAGTNVLFAHFLHHNVGEKEIVFAGDMGVCLQLLDDIFDLYEDLQRGIQTPVTRAESLTQLEQLFHNQCEKILQQISGKPKNLQTPVRFLFARGRVALHQYKKFCTQSGQSFPPEKYQRKDLIVDMEKLSNVFLNFRFLNK